MKKLNSDQIQELVNKGIYWVGSQLIVERDAESVRPYKDQIIAWFWAHREPIEPIKVQNNGHVWYFTGRLSGYQVDLQIHPDYAGKFREIAEEIPSLTGIMYPLQLTLQHKECLHPEELWQGSSREDIINPIVDLATDPGWPFWPPRLREDIKKALLEPAKKPAEIEEREKIRDAVWAALPKPTKNGAADFIFRGLKLWARSGERHYLETTQEAIQDWEREQDPEWLAIPDHEKIKALVLGA